MTTNMSEVMDVLKKISTKIFGFSARQDLLEAAQEQNSRNQEEVVNELKDVLNEIAHSGRRPKKGKYVTYSGGEIYSPNNKPFDFGDIASPSSNGVNTSAVHVNITVPTDLSAMDNTASNPQANANPLVVSQTPCTSLNVNLRSRNHLVRALHLQPTPFQSHNPHHIKLHLPEPP